MSYHDRVEAGQKLAKALKSFSGLDSVILALPRGGIVIGSEIARELKVPLGLVLVKKIGHPTAPEYAIGTVAEGIEPIYNESEITTTNEDWLENMIKGAKEIIEYRRELYYGDDFIPPVIKGKTVLLVDDGIATGLTMEGAVRSIKKKQPKRIVVAVPIASVESVQNLEAIADEVIVLDNPEDFLGSIGAHYLDFEQVDDEDVRILLREARDDLQQTIA